MTGRCDIGGLPTYNWRGEMVYESACEQPPTHRYRSIGVAEGLWWLRCTPHAAWLDESVCVVEPLAVAS